MSLCLVVNPRSAGGRTAGRLDELRALARDAAEADVDVRLTTAVGGGIEVARQASLDGASRVIAVGGDGTASEVCNGLLRAGRPDVVMGVVPAGTGSDLVRTLRVPAGLAAAVKDAVTRPGRPTDAIRVELTGPDGAQVTRFGLNLVSFGMSGEVVQRVNAGSKRLGGALTFLGATLGALTSYRPQEVELGWTDAAGEQGAWRGRLGTAFIGNGQYCGGGMWIGDVGVLDDGLLELLVLPDLPLLRQLRSLPHLYDGRLAQVPGVRFIQVRTLHATTLGPSAVEVDVDGENPGRLELSLSCLKHAFLLARA